MSKFKVGDIIKGNEKSDGEYHITNSRMTKAKVVKVNVYNNPKAIKIEILEHKSGKYIGNRYDVCDSYFDLVKNNETIVIYRKGNEVIALDKLTGNKAVAKCSPDDTFDFNVGARIAFDRLTGVKPFEPKESNNGNFTVLCIEGYYPFMRKGKLYRFINGYTRWEDCGNSSRYECYEHLIESNKGWGKNLVEVKEVKRKAKTGEYILVVDSDGDTQNTYKNGDVLKVAKVTASDDGFKAVHYDYERVIYDKEYVVLEGYTELQDDAIKVGDKVKVIDTGKMYTTDTSWVKENVHDDDLKVKYAYDDDDVGFDRGVKVLNGVFIVKVVKDDKLYIQRDMFFGGGKCHVIGVDGVEKC